MSRAIEMLKKGFFVIYPGNVTSKNINRGKQLILNKVQIIKTGSQKKKERKTIKA